MKLCIDCKHHFCSIGYYCKGIIIYDPVDGNQAPWIECMIGRRIYLDIFGIFSPCGPEGKLWEAR